jgi:SpoIID/LytB domain protein
VTPVKLAAVTLAALLVVAGVSPAHARNDKKLVAVTSPVRIVSRSPLPLAVAGLHSYFGTIELSAATDGLVVINKLPLERYLLGLQEVPPDWPTEALRAQAVAARTYALWTIESPRAGAAADYGFDICASVECQVFAGADVVRFGDGRRWAAAVAGTAGRTIVFEDRPILARYHSTSGGATLDNLDAFPDERSYPYLMPVASPWEQASPLWRWRVRFRLRQLQAILARAGLWMRTNGRLTQVRTIPSRAGHPYPDAVLKGKKKRSVIDVDSLRDALAIHAPALYPSKYPSPWPTSSGFLPETLPSSRVDIHTRDESVTVVGRGWGHGVGMSQWGAYGLARRDADYEEILTHYYTDTDVDTISYRQPITVGVDWGRSQVEIKGEFDVLDGRDRILARAAVGTWRFKWSGDRVVSIDPPRGYRLPLSVGVVRAPDMADAGEPARLTIALSRPAVIRAVSDGEPTSGPGRVVNAGRRTIVWRAPPEPGRYEVRVEATSGGTQRTSEAVEIVVASDEGHAGDVIAEEVEDDEEGDVVVPVLIVVSLLLLGGAVWLSRRMRA